LVGDGPHLRDVDTGLSFQRAEVDEVPLRDIRQQPEHCLYVAVALHLGGLDRKHGSVCCTVTTMTS
jgi:hypothetical protein